MTTHKSKFTPMTRVGGFKNVDHSARSGWLSKIIDAIKSGTPSAIKAAKTIAYHGQLAKLQEGALIEPLEARPSSEIVEPQDVPAVDPQQVRKIERSPALHPAFLKQTRRQQ